MIKFIINSILLLAILILGSIYAEACTISPKLIKQWQEFTKYSSCDYIITSACRTPAKNAAVGGAKNSAHLTGEAYDFVLRRKCNKSLADIAKDATMYFNGVILYKRHIHVDVKKRIYWKLK